MGKFFQILINFVTNECFNFARAYLRRIDHHAGDTFHRRDVVRGARAGAGGCDTQHGGLWLQQRAGDVPARCLRGDVLSTAHPWSAAGLCGAAHGAGGRRSGKDSLKAGHGRRQQARAGCGRRWGGRERARRCGCGCAHEAARRRQGLAPSLPSPRCKHPPLASPFGSKLASSAAGSSWPAVERGGGNACTYMLPPFETPTSAFACTSCLHCISCLHTVICKHVHSLGA